MPPKTVLLSSLALLILAAACDSGKSNGRILASGHVEATEVRVSTKIGGTLEAVRLGEGDQVAVGQEVARIDTVDLEIELAAARAESAAADADLRLKRSGFRAEEIAAAEARVRQAEADLEAARKDSDRMQELFDAGSGTPKSLDDAIARRDVAAAGLQAAGEQLHMLRAGFRAEEIDGSAARLAAAAARIARIEQALRDAVIASPASGIVTSKLVEAGELVGPGAPLVVITDLADAWLNAYVAEPDLGRIRLGQEAEVRTDDGQSRAGRISFISSEAEFTPKNVQTRDERVKLVFKIKIALDNGDGLYKPGMPAEALIDSAGAAR